MRRSMGEPGVPRLRGVLHAVAAPLAVIGGLALILVADSPAMRVAVAVFVATSVALFATSATYHMGDWAAGTKAWLRRADHSNIFLIIAGTYTPLSLLLLPPDQARTLLIIVWSGAIAGLLIGNFWPTAPRWVNAPIYLALGWAAVFYLPGFSSAGSIILGLIVAGGLMYTIGAVVYATKWPQISQAWFGFHEMFHSFTIAGFTAHFAAVALALVAVA
ncbi:MAG: hemolysin III family protein [Actinomycetota bacterium]|nr:hemolysin III family protein [Actinomycetota bacterium]